MAIGDSLDFDDLKAFLPGQTADNYVWNVNCPNGTCPGSGSIAPENTRAFIWANGHQQQYNRLDIKPLGYTPAFKINEANGIAINGAYLEGSLQGRAWLGSANASILAGGLPDVLNGTGTLANCTAGSQTYQCVPSANASSPGKMSGRIM